jgi:hypothetical protein
MPDAQAANTFTVDWELVDEIRQHVAWSGVRTSYAQFEVPSKDFAAWCAALRAEHFLTFRGRTGHTWTSITAVLDTHLVTVRCDKLPASWISFPSGEGDRRWKFNVNPRPTGAAE